MRKLHIFHRSVIYCFPGHSLKSQAETNSLLGFTSDKIITKLIANVTQLFRLLQSHEKLRWLLCCDTQSCFSPLSRSARLALHSCGDLYVHGEAATVHLFRCDAGETAIRHPLPRGPSQRLRRLDNPTFLNLQTWSPTHHPTDLIFDLCLPSPSHTPTPSAETDHSPVCYVAPTKPTTYLIKILFWSGC